MKKGILLMIPVALLLFAGCGRKNNTKDPTTTTTTKTKTTTEQTTTKEDPIPVTNKDIYVSKNGKETSDGADEENPTTLAHALDVLVKSGDTIYVAKDTYTFSDSISIKASGSEVKRCKILAQEGTVFDFTSTQTTSQGKGGISITGSYWQIDNITVKKSDNYGFDISGKGNKLNNCTADSNSNGGFLINGASLTTLTNCISTNNHLVGYFAHGFSISGSGENNTLDSCVSTGNQDSGFYVNATKKTIFEKCYASDNGNEYNTGSINRSGFVFSDVGHSFKNCISYNNAFYGFFVPIAATDKSEYKLTNCSAINNHKKNYNLVANRVSTVTISNILSYNDYDGDGDHVIDATNDFLTGRVENCLLFYSKNYIYIELEKNFENKTGRSTLDLSGYTNKYKINMVIPNEMKKDGKIVYYDSNNNINFYNYLDRSVAFQNELFTKLSLLQTPPFFGANINE